LFFFSHNFVFYRFFSTLGGFQWKLLRLILTGNTSSDPINQEQLHDKNQNDEIADSSEKVSKSLRDQAKSLFICCAGLQISYLVWGVLQEKIMTGYLKLNLNE